MFSYNWTLFCLSTFFTVTFLYGYFSLNLQRNQILLTPSAKPEETKTIRKALSSGQNGGHNQRIVIASNMRSGSTFIGNLLKYDLDTFYSFEPSRMLKWSRFVFDEECTNPSTKLSVLVNFLFECKTEAFEKCSPIKTSHRTG